jgi:hypothetical protein
MSIRILRRIAVWLVAPAAALVFSTCVNASVLAIHLNGFNPDPYAVFGRSVIDPSDNQRVTSDLMDGGRFQLTTAAGSTLLAFCIEPRQFVSPGGDYTYNIMPLDTGATNIGGMGAGKAELLRELFGRYLPDFSAPITRLQGGALQIAAWEVVRENSGVLDVYNGDIYFYPGASEDPAGVVALAQTYVQSLNGAGPKLNDLVALNDVGAQDLVTQVPEPEPMLIFSGGFLLLALSRARPVRR